MPINDVGPCTHNPRHLLQVHVLPWVDSIRWLTNRLALWPGAAWGAARPALGARAQFKPWLQRVTVNNRGC
jgi:hypothetical protein